MANPVKPPDKPAEVKAGPASPKLPDPKPTPKPKARKGRAPKTPKPPKGLVIKGVDIEVFRVKVYFAMRTAEDGELGFKPEDSEAFYNLFGERSRTEVIFDISEVAGFLQHYGSKFIIGMLIYRGKGETFPRTSLSVLVHECDHAATSIIKHLAMNVVDASGDEAHANISGYLARNLYKFLIANNVFIDNGD